MHRLQRELYGVSLLLGAAIGCLIIAMLLVRITTWLDRNEHPDNACYSLPMGYECHVL